VSQEAQEAPRRQDLIRVDWNPTQSLRLYGKLLQNMGYNIVPYGGGTTGFSTNIPDFGYEDSDRYTRGMSFTAAWTITNSMFMEATYGRARNSFTNLPRYPDAFNKSALGLSAFPMLYPGAVQLDLPPRFTWGGRVGTTSPTNSTEYAPFLNVNTSQDVSASLTKNWGQHTAKVGVYVNRGLKPQSSRAAANGSVAFTNDASNPFDSSYPFANAALGIYQTYVQAADWVQGNYLYHNVEWYAQDNWKVNDHLTLDYGLRFYWMQPTYDSKLQTSNFLRQWSASAAARGCTPPALVSVRVAATVSPAGSPPRPLAASFRLGTLLNGTLRR
jgi:hypothetical protein